MPNELSPPDRYQGKPHSDPRIVEWFRRRFHHEKHHQKLADAETQSNKDARLVSLLREQLRGHITAEEFTELNALLGEGGPSE
jgi:hypothetical protein